jgi:hypothetical protein
MPDAKVSFAEWDWTDEEALFIKQPEDSSLSPEIWVDYEIRNRYVKDGHLYMMGTTSPVNTANTDTAAFVQLARPTVLWITDFTASRFNHPPTVPHPDPENNDWVLLDVHYDLPQITVPADGQSPYYRISGTYFYGHVRPPTDTFSLAVFPRPPWLDDLPDRMFNSSEIFETHLNTPKINRVAPDRNFGDIVPPRVPR